MDRNTVLWTMVVFFGASLMFSMIRSAADDEGLAGSLSAQLVAGVLLIAVIALIVRRNR